MEQVTQGSRHRIKFESFSEYLEYHETHQKHDFDRDFYGKGTGSLQGAINLGRAGLSADGLKALDMAAELLPAMEDELIDQRFKPIPSYEGGDVDIALYITGEPECMVTYECVDQTETQPIVTIVIATGILGMVSSEAIAQRGAKVMAMLQAIEYTGVQTELWSDSSTRNRGDSMHGRISVRLKAAGEPFDAGTLMYAMTHDSMHRTLGFNTKDHFPSRFARAMGRERGYGSTVLGNSMRHPEDYPDGAVYIGALRSNYDTLNVEETLQALGLMR